MLFTVTEKIHVAQKMELNRNYFLLLFFIYLIQFLAMKLNLGPVFIDGIAQKNQSIRATEVLLQLVQMHPKVYRS